MHELTYEDSGPEDFEETQFCHFHNLSKKQLLAPAIISTENEESEDTNTNSSIKQKQSSKKIYIWSKEHKKFPVPPFPQQIYRKYSKLSPRKLFHLFF